MSYKICYRISEALKSSGLNCRAIYRVQDDKILVFDSNDKLIFELNIQGKVVDLDKVIYNHYDGRTEVCYSFQGRFTNSAELCNKLISELKVIEDG